MLPVVSSAAENPNDWGVHKIWGSKSLDKISEVRGGYVIVEWKDINPAPGKFDFSIFDSELARYRKLGKRVTIAIRGKFKPDFLFNEVPYHPQRLALGVHDPKGSLAYWHPTYKKRYQELLQAFDNYLNSSPNKSTVYSIRQNINALGTEHSGIPQDKQARSQWIIPPGVNFVPYSSTENSRYKIFVSQTYYDLFVSDYLVLVRSVLLASSESNLPQVVLRAIEDGRIGLVHTSSVPEPPSGSTEKKYKVHIQYGKNGSTRIYAEPYSDSRRGPQPRPQWNYWRLLSDLHAGVSFLSVYGADLEQSSDLEFASAFDFANRYAGYQTGNAVTSSPGAWVALREGGKFLTGDYTFLMSRMSGDASVALESVGPNWQRFGAWARRINANGRMRFKLDDRFANAIRGQNVTVRVVYFNSKSPGFSIETSGSKKDFAGGGTGTWKTVEMTVAASDFVGNSGADITIRAKTDVVLHMVEIVRNGSAGAVAGNAPPKAPTSIVVN